MIQRPDQLLHQAAVELSADAVFFVSVPDFRVVGANRTAGEVLGRPSQELLGVQLDLVVPTLDTLRNGATQLETTADEGRLQAVLSGEGGQTQSMQVVYRRVECDGESVLVLVMRGADHGQTAAHLLEHHMHRDELTDLPKRAVLRQRIGQALYRARVHQDHSTVMFLDLDGFKAINDTHGHRVGDRVLQVVASRLTAAVRPGDVVARYGGDEFVIVAGEVGSRGEAARIARRIAASVAEPIQISTRNLHVFVSIGIALTQDEYADEAAIIDAADRAMYAAKRGTAGDWAFAGEA